MVKRAIIFALALVCLGASGQLLKHRRTAQQGPQDGLVIWLRFNDYQGATVFDSTPNGFNAALTASPTWTTGHRSGSGGLTFNGSSQYGRIASNAVFQGPSNFTVAFWAIMPTPATSKAMAAKQTDAGGSFEWIFKTTTSGGVTNRALRGLSGGTVSLVDTTALDTNWHHWALVGAGTNAYLYKDGTMVRSGSGTGTPVSIAADIQFGRQDAVDLAWWAGTMDDFRFYVRALSSDEILWLYNL